MAGCYGWTSVRSDQEVIGIMSLRDVKLQKQELEDSKFEGKRKYVSGMIVSVNGAVDTGRSGYIWVRERGQESSVFAAFNIFVKPLEGLPIILGYPYGVMSDYEVMGVDKDYLDGYDGYDGQTYVASHHWGHQWPEGDEGTDAVLVYQPALQPFKAIATGSMSITVAGGRYHYENIAKLFESSTYDLTSFIPGTDKKVRLLVYLNALTNLVNTISTEEYPNLDSVELPTIDIPDQAIPICYVELNDTSTGIDSVTDVRDFLRVRPNTYNITNGKFGPYSPLVDERSTGGWLSNAQGILLVSHLYGEV